MPHNRRSAILGLLALSVALLMPAVARAGITPVRFTEGIARGFPLLRDQSGKVLAQGELTQVADSDCVRSRMTFRFGDGSLYDETVVFSQHGVFTLLSYHLVQQGPSFPETLDASFDRQSGRYQVRYRADEDSPVESFAGKLELPPDVYNGMLGTVVQNLPPGTKTTVEVVAFTPKPRLVKIIVNPMGEEPVSIGEQRLPARRYLVKPDLGLFASLLVTDLPPNYLWVLSGDVPGFARFEGTLYFMGPIWRIELQ